MTATGRLLAGRYRLGRVIGEGGMSVVYEAVDEHLRRHVAVKILRPQFTADDQFLARFDHEARAAASLSHPNIVAIHDSGSDGELHFIVMELVDGPSLAAVLAERGRLPPDRAVAIAAQVAEGLAAAHRRGIVHRDIKPANVLIDRRGRALVTDFGIARAFSATALTTTGTILGSLPYLSPEQSAGADASPATDIYALGTVLFEMLTGRRPFEASTPAALTAHRLNIDPPEPSDVDPSLPPGLDPLVMRALARDPADRYPSARNFAQSLDAWRRRWLSVRSVMAAGELMPVGGSPDASTEALTVEGPDADEPTRTLAVSGPAVAGRDAATRLGPRTSGAPPSRGRFSRRVVMPVALPAFALAAVLVLASMAALANTGLRPAPTPTAAAVLGVTSPPSLAASEPVLVALSPTAGPTPSPTVASTPPPTPPPTTRPTARPTARPTPAPTPPPVVAVGPSAQVVRFYDAVAAHDFGEAAALWSSSMRQRYPPDTYIDGRFANTTGFDIRRATVTSQSGDRATVSVDIVELRSTSPTQERWVGSWSLVRQNGRWLLDDPNLSAA